MGRLIDADRLLAYIEESRAPSFFCNDVCDLFTKWVNIQPTAFDKEKVLEELDKKGHDERSKVDCLTLRCTMSIVQRGGVE